MSVKVIRRSRRSTGSLIGNLRRATRAVFLDAAERTKANVVGKILEGATLGAGHVPSLPGEAPHADTGQLHQSYATSSLASEDTVIIGSPLKYARDLELGTKKMAARPHLSPAFREELPKTRRNLRLAAKKAMRK